MTVREMLGRMDAQEFNEWQAYYTLEPFGQLRGDLQAAQICKVLVGMLGGKWLDPFKFILDFAGDYKEELPTQEELIEKGKLLCLQMGGKIVDKNGNVTHGVDRKPIG
jgi:hypothetical protein